MRAGPPVTAGEHIAVVFARDREFSTWLALVSRTDRVIGAMTTNLERSKPMWRSSSGRTPRPIEPSEHHDRAGKFCVHHVSSVGGPVRSIHSSRQAVSGGCQAARAQPHRCGQRPRGGKVRLGLALSAGADQARARRARRGGAQPSRRSRSYGRASTGCRSSAPNSQTRVIRRVSDQQDGGVAKLLRGLGGAPHQSAPIRAAPRRRPRAAEEECRPRGRQQRARAVRYDDAMIVSAISASPAAGRRPSRTVPNSLRCARPSAASSSRRAPRCR